MPEVIQLPADALDWLRDEATAVVTRPAVFRIEGPGALECLQGVLTSDLIAPGAGSLVYGALLTPKGMIVLDLWCARLENTIVVFTDAEAREPALELFRRRLPPRLAKVTDQTGETVMVRLLGSRVRAVVETAGLPWPDAGGRVQTSGTLLIGRHEPTAPWAGFLAGPQAELDPILGRLQAAGALVGGESHLEAARILAGWPGLGGGREIGDKTLPQEVRFDEIGGVSYTKGCYVGQETVARVHFRGHPNRLLRGIVLPHAGGLSQGVEVVAGARAVGTLSSLLVAGDAGYGLAVIRREVEPGAEVQVGDRTGRVSDLPFAL